MSTRVAEPVQVQARRRQNRQETSPRLKPLQTHKSVPAMEYNTEKHLRKSVMTRKQRTNKSVSTIDLSGISRTDRPASLYLSRSASFINPIVDDSDDAFEEIDHERLSQTERSERPGMRETIINKKPVVPPIHRQFTFTGYDIMDDDESKQSKEDVNNVSDVERQTNVQRYIAACKMLGLYPVTSLCHQINSNTTEISINSHPLGPPGAQALAIALVNNRQIRTLDLRDNDIGACGAVAVVDMLKENTFITEMRLCDNGIGSKGAELFANLVDSGRHLHTLDLSGNNLSDKDAKHIAYIMEYSSPLKVLAVGHNRLSDNGAFDIGRAIALNDTLQELDLQWNHIRGRGTIAIAIGLQKNVALKRLNLSWNGFAQEGSVGLARALSENRTLLELDVTNNRIGPKGVVAILKGLSKNEGLSTLRIGQNPYSPEVAKSILTTVAESSKCVLQTLDLTDIVVRKDFFELWDSVKIKRLLPLRIVTGPVIKSMTKEEVDNNGIDWRDPVMRMFGYMQEMGYRCIDLLNRLDKDKSLSVDRQEFKLGMHSINLPVTEAQLDTILDRLDTDGDGEVDFRELLTGEREFKRKMRIRKMRMLKMSNVAEDAIEKLLKIDEL